MNLCLRPKAVDVITVTNDISPPVVPEDFNLRGRAAEIHRQLSHMNVPILAPRDQLVINLDFKDVLDGSPKMPRTPHRTPRTAFKFPIGGIMATSAAATAPSQRPSQAGDASSPALEVDLISAGRTTSEAVLRVESADPLTASPGIARKATAREEGGGGGVRDAWAAEPSAALEGASASPIGSTTGSGTGGSRPMAPSWAEGQGPPTRGFVRVKSVRAPQGLSWTHSRKCLEVLLAAERGNRSIGYLSHEQRLRERLERLNLEMVVVAGDGNCQFRSISNELYGTQDYHFGIRRQAVSHILSQRDTFGAFLGDDFDQYVRQMERSGTWADELTLRAVCDSFGLTVHVVTSDEDYWYLTYEPEVRKLDREIFLTYIAPIHYNSIRRRSSLKTMALSVGRSLRKLSVSSVSGGSGGKAANSAPCSPLGAGGGGGGRTAGDDEGGGGGRPAQRRLPASVEANNEGRDRGR